MCCELTFGAGGDLPGYAAVLRIMQPTLPSVVSDLDAVNRCDNNAVPCSFLPHSGPVPTSQRW